MDRLSRRAFSVGCIAAVGGAAAAPTALGASKRSAKSQQGAPSKDRRLVGDLKAAFETLALMHLAGWDDGVTAALGALQAIRPELDPKRLRHVFRALVGGDAGTIEAALSQAAYPIEIVSAPLILLGRAAILPILHDNVLRRLGGSTRSGFTAGAAVTLAAADEWDQALRVLTRARESGAGIDIEPVAEDQLWKYAYRYQRVETVMPALAEMPFSPEFPELTQYRKWRLKAYQIRAGLPGERVPIIEGEQALGYSEAAAMQVAALADDQSAADYVAALRRAVQSRTVSVRLAQRGFAMSASNASQLLITAEAQMAARRKDSARTAAVARTPLNSVIVYPPSVVIDALLDERDWRTAAAIADEHARKGPDPMLNEDVRVRHFAKLYLHIALAAAREGDDTAAATLLVQAKAPRRLDRSTNDAVATTSSETLGPEVLLGLVAGDRVPRKYLSVIVPALILWDDRQIREEP